MTKPARRLLANLGFIEPPPCYIAVTEAALLAAERRGMWRAVHLLEGMADREVTSVRREFLQQAALRVAAAKVEEE